MLNQKSYPNMVCHMTYENARIGLFHFVLWTSIFSRFWMGYIYRRQHTVEDRPTLRGPRRRFNSITDLSLTQTAELYDFNLTQEPVTAENVLEQLNLIDRFRKFCEDSDFDNLIKSTKSKNTRKNTSWSVKTFKEWRSARIYSTGCNFPSSRIWPNQQTLTNGRVNLSSKPAEKMASRTLQYHCTCCVSDY